jgi:hypothetical protein
MNTRISQTGTEREMPGAEIEPKPDSKQVSQDVLVADIERTREDLARTIDAISDRVSPANVARRAAGRVRERVAAVDPVMAGGAVVVVAGLTVAWLLLRRRKRLFSLARRRARARMLWRFSAAAGATPGTGVTPGPARVGRSA